MRTGGTCVLGAIIASLAFSAAIAAGAKSIFDDDWVPPKASEAPPRPAAPDVSPVVPPVTPPAPKPPGTPDAAPTPKDPRAAPVATGTPVFGESVARRAIPTRPEQAAVR